MRALITILIVLVVGFGAYKVWEYWNEVKDRRLTEEKSSAGADIQPERLPGLPYQLEAKLRDAQQAGPAALKRFLEACKRYPSVKDPRLAWIELDYVVLISGTDPVEAKKIFWNVKQRTATDSPVYPRIRAMAKTYE
ncbi:MAG TPA: hypothetical protein VEO53_14755 [Candidatus Binatia bacterium]|nr:hypothetical protein [Candidatus Binatia bacterium]